MCHIQFLARKSQTNQLFLDCLDNSEQLDSGQAEGGSHMESIINDMVDIRIDSLTRIRKCPVRVQNDGPPP